MTQSLCVSAQLDDRVGVNEVGRDSDCDRVAGHNPVEAPGVLRVQNLQEYGDNELTTLR